MSQDIASGKLVPLVPSLPWQPPPTPRCPDSSSTPVPPVRRVSQRSELSRSPSHHAPTMRLLTPRVVRLLRTLIIAVIVVYALHYILPAVSAAVYLIRLILSGAPTQPPKPPPSPPVKPSLEYADPYNYTVVSPLLPRGVSTFPPDDFTKHLVLMTTSKSDIRWLKTLPPTSGLDQIIYHADGPLMDVPVNKGNEAMAYLTYLIEYYDTLPDIVVFIHDHAQA